MNNVLADILDWSEVWATVIPLLVYIIYQPKFRGIKPIFIYLIIALIIYVIIDIIMTLNMQGEVLADNNVFYNIISAVRLLLFTWFFKQISNDKTLVRYFVLLIYTVATAVIFMFFDPILQFSSKLVTAECIIILFCCIRYFNSLPSLKKDANELSRPVIMISSAILFYYAVILIIDPVYQYLIDNDTETAVGIWDIKNIVYIITMVTFALALRTKSNRSSVHNP